MIPALASTSQMPARSAAARTAALVAALRRARCYPHPAPDVDVVETPMSSVVLAGDYAYKIKKPLVLRIADFSSLESRRRHCEEEVRLNRRTTPLYLEVVPITGPIEEPVVAGSGAALEYAVKMRRFPQDSLLDRLARAGKLQRAHIDGLAAGVAQLHARADRAPAAVEYGDPGHVLDLAFRNLLEIEAVEHSASRTVPRELHDRVIAMHARLSDALERRKLEGWVRECHGDPRLGNAVLIAGEPFLVDAVEFNRELRWTDVMNDVAAVLVDLHLHGKPGLAARFLDEYLVRSGDYGGLEVLRFYLVHRALARAAVSSVRSHDVSLSAPERAAWSSQRASHLELALRFSGEQRGGLVLMHGVSGSGKTHISQVLVEALGAVRLRCDIEYRRLNELEPSSAPRRSAIPFARETESMYRRVAAFARQIVRAGYPAIVDAAFLRRSERRRFRDLAAAEGIAFRIVECEAPEAVLRARCRNRVRLTTDATASAGSLLDIQRPLDESLDDDERSCAITCDTSRDVAPLVLAEALTHEALLFGDAHAHTGNPPSATRGEVP